MPNIKSAKKRVLVNQTKALQNKTIKSNLKTVIKKAEVALTANSTEKSELVTAAIKKIDQAAAKGIIHKNCASRRKSKLALKLNV